jgi:hypothetical protein
LIFEKEIYDTLPEKEDDEDDMLDLAMEVTETWVIANHAYVYVLVAMQTMSYSHRLLLSFLPPDPDWAAKYMPGKRWQVWR